MVSKAAAFSTFILRILALKASLIAVALMASSHFLTFHTLYYGFEDFATFRYVMAVAVMSLAYGVVQLPFAASYAFKNKRLMPRHFEFYADKVMCLFLATGSGAGIAVCRELNKANGGGGGNYNYFNVQYSIFWDKLLAASVSLFLAWLCLAVVSIIFYNHDDNTNSTLSTHHDNNNQSNTPNPLPNEPAQAQHTHVPTDEHVKPSTDDV